MSVTITDIAKELKISANTVSKALNGKDKVSPAMREKVIATAEKLGYQRNKIASRLAQRPIKIGVLINGYDENYYTYTLNGIEKARRKLMDYKVQIDVKMVEINVDTEKTSLAVLESFGNENYDGVIINDFHSDKLKKVIEKLSPVKVALLNYSPTNCGQDFSMTNDYACAGGLAAQVIGMINRRGSQKSAVIYSKEATSSGQKSLQNSFKSIAAQSGIDNVFIAGTMEELKIILSQNPQIGGIYVSMATCLDVCKFVKENYSCENKPALVVSDLYEALISYIEDGTVDATIYQAPDLQAYTTVMEMYKLISEGKEIEHNLKVKPTLVVKSNYRLYINQEKN